MDGQRRKQERCQGEKSSGRTELPADIIEEILSWVPAKSLTRFRCLNKCLLHSLTHDSNFLNKHLSRVNHNASNRTFILQIRDSNHFLYVPDGEYFHKAVKLDTWFIPNNAQIIGSSSGLICFSRTYQFSYWYDEDYGDEYNYYDDGTPAITLWNPMTGQYKTIPKPQIDGKDIHGWGNEITLGFGFHPIVKEYKVVRVVQCDINHLKAEVYTLSKDCWKSVGSFPCASLDQSSSTVLNGIVHWGGCHGPLLIMWDLILSFDLGNDMLRVVPIPELGNSPPWAKLCLRAFRGCLSMFVLTSDVDIDVWVMKKYGVKESWTKLFSMHFQLRCHYPLNFSGDEEVLLEKSSPGLVSYNFESKERKEVQISEHYRNSRFVLVPYVESLIDGLS